jgi:hemolysin III
MKLVKKMKDPGSAITHLIGLVFSVIAVFPLLEKATHKPAPIYIIACAIYLMSLILLYAASSAYHSFDICDKVNRRLKKFDHMMISVLIAGTYTPICLLALERKVGIILLAIVWSLALLAILFKAFWVTCPKWISSVLYIGMGWTCILAFTHIYEALPLGGFLWLLIGGILYTVGGVIYALKLSLFNNRHKYFGSHEIFHLFVMAGSFCHYIVVYAFVL